MKSDPQVGKASRRQHDLAFKQDLVRQCLEPGASVSAIALRGGVNANMLFKWRRDHLRHAGSSQPAVLLPIQVTPVVDVQAQEPSPATAPPSRPPARGGVIELEIAGAQLRLRGPVDEDSLRSVLRALRHSA
ncbi:transposase [Pseudorhodoferax sp. Leaf274]|uniref:IS66-like element accessory protein TnpA n=1 Tax=Pseudorhodoferax sp. Leaf274 TaxID=1736318 RepID=UPI00138F02D5|nr:transposase [Pseudorhodoferax sp. Leaf274]